jgi:HAD superfamily hydrolase (TIGR01490 family)
MAVVTIGAHPSTVPGAAAWDQREPARFAVFDLDRTLLPGSSLGHFARELAAARVITRLEVARHVVHQGVFTHHGLGARTLERLCGQLVAAASGRPQAQVEEIAATVAPAIARRLYRGARWLVGQHAERGDRLILLSAGPQELVGAVAEVLGFHDALGTVGEVADGHYTGRLLGDFCHGDGKLRRLRTVLGPLELRRTSAYGDACSDLPVLRAVADPVAVNPDRGLQAAAETARWPILRFG